MISGALYNWATDIAIQQCSQLVLNSLRLPEESLLHGQLLESILLAPHPVDLCIAVSSRPFG